MWHSSILNYSQGFRLEHPKQLRPISRDIPNTSLNKINTTDTFTKTGSLKFRGAPWRLNPSQVGVREYGSISANDAIKIFSKLKLGNYLDIGDDKFNYYANKSIRDYNLSFLDRITDTREKEKFIRHYMDLTGFPNLRNVSEKIKTELNHAIYTAQNELRTGCYDSRYHVIQAGYDGVCSVGKGKALPGSDIDKAYVIIQGNFSSNEEEIVNQFKGKIWENTDQRILSYNHDDAAFPQVYTERQFFRLLESADRVAVQNVLKPNAFDIATALAGLPNIKHFIKTHQLEKIKQTYNEDYVEANKFFIDICKRFPKKNSDYIDIFNPSRENIKNVGFVIEAMREGEKFYLFDTIKEGRLENSLTYNYTNLSQLKALKNRGDKKPKRLARESLVQDFPSWDIDKQFRFVKTLIHGSCGNNTDFTTEFPQYFSKKGNDPFAPLIRAIMGD